MNEALRLAEELEWQTHWKDHAAELRRLLAENEALKAERDEDRRREYGYSQQVVDALTKERDALKAQRDALLEALRAMRVKYGQYACRVCDLADAAIKKAEEA